MKAALFLGGAFTKPSRLKKHLKKTDFVVAADRGAKYALKVGLIPDAVVGDFDSLSKSLLKRLKLRSKLYTHSKHKNQTDGELALRFLLKKKPKEILIFGALGERLDHTLANLELLTLIPRRISASIIDHDVEIVYGGTGTLSSGYAAVAAMRPKRVSQSPVKYVFTGRKGDLVSILPFGASQVVMTTTGLKYALKNGRLRSGSHGLSNVMTASRASVSISRGAAFIFHYFGV